MQTWWWKALVSMGFVMANTHFGRDNWMSMSEKPSQICPLSYPSPSSRCAFFFQGRVFCLFEDRYYMNQEPYWWWVRFLPGSHSNMCLCQKENSRRHWEGDHVCIWRQMLAWSQLDLNPSTYFPERYEFMKKDAYYNGRVCKCIAFTQKQFPPSLFVIVMATLYTFTVSFQCGNTFNV